MNRVYRDLIISRAAAAVGAATALTGVKHSGLKGALREILIRDLFRPLLPTDVGVGTGEIISSTGQRSSQTDIVIFDRGILPPILFEQSHGVFPIESVLLTVEVKSVLKKVDLRPAEEAAQTLRTLIRAPGEFDSSGLIPKEDKSIQHESTLFAFDTDLGASVSVAEAYDSVRSSREFPGLTAICVVGRGFWLWDPREAKWKKSPQFYPLQEVVNFIALLMNSYGRIAASRGRPRLGRYVMQSVPDDSPAQNSGEPQTAGGATPDE
jgi:hypothetical protein